MITKKRLLPILVAVMMAFAMMPMCVVPVSAEVTTETVTPRTAETFSTYMQALTRINYLTSFCAERSTENYTYDLHVFMDHEGQDQLWYLIPGEGAEADRYGVDYEITLTCELHGEVTFAGKKMLEGRSLTEDDTFTFTVTENGNTIQTVKNDASGKICFEPIEYKHGDKGLHTYTVTETSENGNGITVDSTSYTVTVTVSFDGTPTLKTDVSDNAEKLDFKNTYEAVGEIVFSGTKTIAGRSLTADDVYTFTLADADGNEIQTVENGEDGSIRFEPIMYTQEDVGTHTYTIRETSKDGNHVKTDKTVYTETVTVSDNRDGTLKVTADNNAKALNFINKYVAHGELVLSGKKELQGRALTADDVFTFTVKEDGKTVATGKNDRTGKILFSEIEYDLDDVGMHTYVITEDASDVKNVSSSEKSVKVSVEVTDNGDGTLKATCDRSSDEITFVNLYKNDSSGTDKTDKSAKTGDDTNILMYLMIMFTALAAIAIVAIYRKRRS